MHFRRVLESCEIAGIAGRGPVGALPWRIGGRAQGVRAQGGGNSSPCGPTVGAPATIPIRERLCTNVEKKIEHEKMDRMDRQ